MITRSAILSLVATLVVGINIRAAEPLNTIANLLPNHGPDNGIRGITLAPIEDQRLGPIGYGSKICEVALGEIAGIGATWISITPFGRMDNLESVDLLHDFEIPGKINRELIRQTAEQAHSQGLKVALIPHLYVMSGEWRGEILPRSDADFEEWFTAYDSFVASWARLAQEIGADLFSIGVEFKSSTNLHGERWRSTIELVRSIYKGPITYSANWDEIDQVEFWDAVDFIGVNAFWPLVKKPGEGYAVMKERATQISNQLEATSLLWNRPVLFTEFGVKSAKDSALAPWEWPEHCSKQSYDETYQAEAYEAVFETFTDQPWFAGLFIWKYFSDPFDNTQESVTGFSPRNKLAEDSLSFWFLNDWATCVTIPKSEYFLHASH
jgi:Glycoside Hydrolase Family 113